MKIHTRNPYSDVSQMQNVMQIIMNTLSPYPFPYMSGVVSVLGGKDRPTILLRISLQTKEEWKNGIFENSPYAHVSIDHKGVMEMFSGCIKPKLRKTRVMNVEGVIKKLQVWGEKVRAVPSF